MRQLTICHSFWTVPCYNNRYDIDAERQIKINLYCFATSLAYAKAHNCKVNFYGDAKAISIFKILPYDNFIEFIIPSDTNASLWAQGKFYALKQMNIGDIHIDGDVFMRGDKIYDILNSDYDCIVQGIEDENQVSWDGYDLARKETSSIKFLNECNSEKTLAYNTGIIGFKNQQFKELYMNQYFDSLDKAKNIKFSGNCIPDLVLEQQHLYQLANKFNYNVKTLLGKGHIGEDGKNSQIYKDAIDLNYQHVLSSYKYHEFPQIRHELSIIDPKRVKLLDLVTKNIDI